MLTDLIIGHATPLPSLTWLPALRQLQSLKLGSAVWPLRLPPEMGRLTALEEAVFVGSPVVVQGPLPPCLTALRLRDCCPNSVELPAQVRLGPLRCAHTCPASAAGLKLALCCLPRAGARLLSPHDAWLTCGGRAGQLLCVATVTPPHTVRRWPS